MRDIWNELRRLQREHDRLRAQVPVRLAPGGDTATPIQFLQIIGGQTLTTGQEGIDYSASLTLTQIYDPDVDTVYPAGLGNAWLYQDGTRQANRVLVRFDNSDHQTPLLSGRRVRVLGTTTLTVDSGPDAGETMAAYLVTWE